MVQPIRVRVPQPLEPYVKGFWAELLAQGYSVLSARNLIRLMAHLSRWLHRQHLQVRDLTPRRVEQFLNHVVVRGTRHGCRRTDSSHCWFICANFVWCRYLAPEVPASPLSGTGPLLAFLEAL